MITLFRGGKVVNRYAGRQLTGEKMPGDLDRWSTYSADVNEILHSSYGTLCERSATLYHTYAPVASAINKTTGYAIGSGNVFRSHPDYRALGISREEANEWGKKFQLLLHYNLKRLGWYEKQAVVFRGALITGDSLLFFVREDGDLDLVESGGNTIDWRWTDSRNWTLGIKHDRYKRRSAVRTLGGGGSNYNFVNQKTRDQQVVQFFVKEMPRQMRGLPLAYKIIAMAKNHDRHMDATVQRAVLESIMFAYTNTEKTDVKQQINNQVAAARKKRGLAKNAWAKLTGSRDLTGGNVYQLKNDESIQFTDLKTPSKQFDEFNQWMIKFVAMATDTTPGIIMSNYPTSYSSHRGEFNDFWKVVEWKRGLFNEKIGKVVIREVAKKMILDGQVNAPGFFTDPIRREAWLAGSFLGPVPGAINPRQEVEAERIAVEQAFKTRGDAAAKYGNEFENIVETWAEQERMFKEMPLTERERAIQEDVADE